MNERKNPQCHDGELQIYCHHDKELVRCRDCWPCAECEPCAYCDEWPCPYSDALEVCND